MLLPERNMYILIIHDGHTKCNENRQKMTIFIAIFSAKLSLNPLYKRTGEFMEDYRRLTAMQHAIEEEILHELIYTEEAV